MYLYKVNNKQTGEISYFMNSKDLYKTFPDIGGKDNLYLLIHKKQGFKQRKKPAKIYMLREKYDIKRYKRLSKKEIEKLKTN